MSPTTSVAIGYLLTTVLYATYWIRQRRRLSQLIDAANVNRVN
ncbi:unannotated protein [freshwater metagenome]|uniref:Unannotated protein n=1 Tax=freshwater metagenome TaxID=449393 RepID=A0A6J5ZFN5_9ZZZZ